MHNHLENLTKAQAYVASEGAKETGGMNAAENLIEAFVATVNDSTEYLVNRIVDWIGAKAFVKTACQIEASEGTLDFFFEGFMDEPVRIDWFQKYLGSIEDFLSDEADIEDILMVERVERARKFFPQELGTDRPIPNEVEFSQGELYEVFLDDNTDHEHYNVVASSIACEVLETIADKLTTFINKAAETANGGDTGAISCSGSGVDAAIADAEYQNTFKEGYDHGFNMGYAQAKKDIVKAAINTQPTQD